MNNAVEKLQKAICSRYGVAHFSSPALHKVGIASNVRGGATAPINGLRHPPKGDTTGWYIWAGQELLSDSDFFKPLHVEHLCDWCPVVQKYLGLPPGWRFLIASNHEDVWFDEALLAL